jgi:hypothetical protein
MRSPFLEVALMITVHFEYILRLKITIKLIIQLYLDDSKEVT